MGAHVEMEAVETAGTESGSEVMIVGAWVWGPIACTPDVDDSAETAKASSLIFSSVSWDKMDDTADEVMMGTISLVVGGAMGGAATAGGAVVPCSVEGDRG